MCCSKRQFNGSMGILFTIGMMLGANGTVLGETQSETPEPSDYVWQEIAVGTLGAAAGGILAGVAFRTGLGYVVGSALFSSLAVMTTGARAGVRGNMALALSGAIVGAPLGFWAGYFIVRTSRLPSSVAFWVFWGTASLVPGIMATMGFNIGAKIEIRTVTISHRRVDFLSVRLRW